MFEDLTVGKLLAMGDIRALLARIIGKAATDNVLTTAGVPQACSSSMDGTGFNPYCAQVWAALRKEFPTRIDLKSLKGDPLGAT